MEISKMTCDMDKVFLQVKTGSDMKEIGRLGKWMALVK